MLRRGTLLVGEAKSNKPRSNQIKSNQIKGWFLERTSRSSAENQHTQPTYDALSGNRTRVTSGEGERPHHCAILKPQRVTDDHQSERLLRLSDLTLEKALEIS